jgi:hypothetical protein
LPRDAVHIVWDDDLPDSEIFYRTNAGDVFGRTTDNLSNNGAVSAGPAIAVSGNNVYVVWSDNTPGRGEIFYRRSIDGGATFSSTINLSNNTGFSDSPDIAITGNHVSVVWRDSTPGNTEILYRRSMNSGVTFSSTINLSNNTGFSADPAIAVSGNNVYVTWRDNTPGNYEILLRKSINTGVTFGSTINVSQNVGFSELPAIAVSPNNF